MIQLHVDLIFEILLHYTQNAVFLNKPPSTTNSSHSTSVKPSRKKMEDASELAELALAALQKGDGGVGKKRLKQAIGVWGR